MIYIEKMFMEYKDVVSVEDLMQMLSIGKNTAYELLGKGNIKSIKVGKKYRIPKFCIIDYLVQKTEECYNTITLNSKLSEEKGA